MGERVCWGNEVGYLYPDRVLVPGGLSSSSGRPLWRCSYKKFISRASKFDIGNYIRSDPGRILSSRALISKIGKVRGQDPGVYLYTLALKSIFGNFLRRVSTLPRYETTPTV